MSGARTIFGLAAAIVTATAMANPALAAKKDNSVRFAWEQTLNTIDPYFTIANGAGVVADAVWDTLIFRDPRTGDYKGELATAWRWINDTTLELDLRQGVKFHNGAAFDADDVVYTLNFVSRPENNTISLSRVRWIDHVDKLEKYKVRIILRQTFPAAIAYLASWVLVIHPHEYYARVGPKGMNEHPIGTGPFRVVEHALGKYIRLERNLDYFKDSPKAQPKIERLEIRFIPDAQTRVAEIVSGGVDLIMNVSRDQAEQLRELPSLKVVAGETIRYAYLQMNSTPKSPAPQLRDVRVRQAIMHAIDRETMAKFLLGEGSRVLHAECHPSQFGCSDLSARRYAYNPVKARQLLAEAGYPNGFSVDLYAWFGRNQMEAVMGYLSAVGIKARLRFMEQAAAGSARQAGKTALFISNTGSFGIYDVSNSAPSYHEFSPDDVNRDPEVRDLLLRGDSAMDPEVRKDAYAKALALIAERAYVLPLYSMPNYYLATKDLVFTPYTDEKPRFWEMSWK